MRLQKTIPFLFALVVLLVPSAVQADGESHLRLSPTDTTLKLEQEVTVDVLIEHAPTIYGADVLLTFDPSMLEVVDMDEDTPGIQVQPGHFINPENAFILQHNADNETGKVDYALSLLNPAPPVEGDGLLVQVTFRAKAEGSTIIAITEGLFGTQTGETVAPVLDSVELAIGAEADGVLDIVTDSKPQAPESNDSSQSPMPPNILIFVLIIIGAVGIGILVGRLSRKRS